MMFFLFFYPSLRPLQGEAAGPLSEGEVALSPGDAGWYSTFAAKMGKWGTRTRDEGELTVTVVTCT